MEAIIESLLHHPFQLEVIQAFQVFALDSYLKVYQSFIVVLGRLLVGLLYVAHLQLEVYV